MLVVDVDDDLSRAGIATPLLGEGEVLRAAERFALYDPEDSDLNALFAAVKIARELRGRGYDAVPGVVAGHEAGGTEAALRAREQLEELLRRSGFDGVVFVSDGSEDETLLPVIESMLPVYGVERVIVKQHRGVEETYVLLARYIKKALTEPRFARLFLGIPGVILVVISALALLGMLRQALLTGLLLLGVAMVIRGFELEDRLVSLFSETPVSMIAYGTAGLSVALAVGLLVSQVYGGVGSPARLAAALRGFTGLVGFAAGIALFGHAVSKLITGTLRPGRELVYVAVVAASLVLMDKIAEAASLMKSLSIGSFIEALVEVNFALYVVASILGLAVAWRLGRYLDAVLHEEEGAGEGPGAGGRGGDEGGGASGRSVSRGAGRSGAPGTAPRG